MSAADVMAAVAAALGPTNGAFPTAAGSRISLPGMLPTQSDQYPRLKLRFVSETKQSLGRGSVAFTTTVTIRVDGEVSEPVPLLDDVNRSAVECRLTVLKTQVERAIINSYPLFGMVQQLAGVATQWAYSAQDTMLGGIQSDYTFEIFEDETDFPPPDGEPIAGFDVHLPAGGPGFSTTSSQE